jgi:hypothetical protein
MATWLVNSIAKRVNLLIIVFSCWLVNWIPPRREERHPTSAEGWNQVCSEFPLNYTPAVPANYANASFIRLPVITITLAVQAPPVVAITVGSFFHVGSLARELSVNSIPAGTELH